MFLAMLGLCRCGGFSLVGGAGATLQWCMSVAVASLVAKHGLWGARFSSCSRGLSCGSQAPQHRRNSCAARASSEACDVFLAQGSNPCLLHWQAGSLPLSHQGSPIYDIFKEQISTVGLGREIVDLEMAAIIFAFLFTSFYSVFLKARLYGQSITAEVMVCDFCG